MTVFVGGPSSVGVLGVQSGATNNLAQQTLTGVTTGTQFGVFQGTSSAPSTTQNPPVFMQRYSSVSLAGEFNQTVSGLFMDVEAKGSGTASPNLGANIGALFSTNAVNTNQGTALAPNFDYKGDVIGLAGFAYNSGAGYSSHITTGIWAWAKGPTLDATTYTNLPAGNWSTVGLEINVSYDHTDPGVQTSLVGKGSTVGLLASNFRTAGSGVLDWTFGSVLTGTPDDGNWSSTDIDNWNGFHTGHLIDKIKNYGIYFGTLFKNGSYGIAFPASFAGTQEPAAGIAMGGAKLNIGTYTGTTFNSEDIWQNGGRIYYRTGGVSQKFLTDNAGITLLSATHTFSNGGGFTLRLDTVVNAVNYMKITNGAAGTSPSLSSVGAGTDLDLILTPKGTGVVQYGTHSAIAAETVTGYITIKDAGGTTRKLAVVS